MRRRGFTLLEVVMAMVVMEVGLLGVVGTLVLAARTMRRAASVERVVTEAESLYDSVSRMTDVGSGEVPAVLGRLRWRVGPDGALDVAVLSGDTVLFSLEGRTRASVVR